MNGSGLKKIVTEIIVIFVLGIVAVIGGIYLSSFRKGEREQTIYIEKYKDVLKCSRYDKISSPILDNYDDINEVYIGYDGLGAPQGYVIDVQRENEFGQQIHLLVGIDYESATLTGVKRLRDESNPIEMDDDKMAMFRKSVIGKRIPVAFTGNISEEDTSVSHSEIVINGLHDGVYFAQSVVKDQSGYIDYVEITVESGRISRVRWDAVNVDPTTEDRSQASLSGAYSIPGLDWATQSYNVCHALIEYQDPDLLNMKSDGTTAIVEGVTCDIRRFIDLSEECIDYAHSGYRKERYLADYDVVLKKIFRGTAESLNLYNEDGFIVESFDQKLGPFEIKNSDGVVTGLRTIRELAAHYNSSDDDKDKDKDQDDKPASPTDAADTDSGSKDTADPSADGGLIDGAEDGVINPDSQSDNSLIDSVDDLPMSEIASYVDAVPGAASGSKLAVSCINSCYKFMKDYLNWLV